MDFLSPTWYKMILNLVPEFLASQPCCSMGAKQKTPIFQGFSVRRLAMRMKVKSPGSPMPEMVPGMWRGNAMDWTRWQSTLTLNVGQHQFSFQKSTKNQLPCSMAMWVYQRLTLLSHGGVQLVMGEAQNDFGFFWEIRLKFGWFWGVPLV